MQVADSGTFTCVAASPAGVADRNFTLQVHGRRWGRGQAGPLAFGCENQASREQTRPLGLIGLSRG